MHKVSMEKKLTRRAATRSGRMSTKKTITQHKNYLLADDGRLQVWANYNNSIVWVTRNGELVNRVDNATIADVEKVLHDAGF